MPSPPTNANSVTAALLLALCVCSGPAFAQGEPAARAQALFEEGVKLLERGAWADACAKLSESHELDPAGGTALDIGFCEEKQGHLASALAAYNDALSRAIEDGRTDRERLVRQRIEELSRRASRIRIRLAPAVSSLPNLEVQIEGVAIARASLSGAIPVDPGKRTVVVRAAGRRALVRDVWIAGEAALVEVEVETLEDTTPRAPTAGHKPAVLPAVITGSAPRDTGLGGRRTLGLVFAGQGVVAAAVGTVAGIAAANEHDESNRACPAGVCTQAGVDAEDRAGRLAWVSNGGFIVGGLLVATGAYLFLTAPKPGAASRLRVGARGFTVAF